MHKQVMSTEDMIFNEIQNRGSFKARPLNRKLFENRETTAADRSASRQETTKFKEFNLTMKKSTSENTQQSMEQQVSSKSFKAMPMPKTTYKAWSLERKSAPPKMTQPKIFNLNTERRGAMDRKKLVIENPKSAAQGFKSRPMPSFPDPPSPQRSSRSFQFQGKTINYCPSSHLLLIEFNLATNTRERKSAPPLK